MHVVVRAMIDRLRADFSDGDLNLCFEMFDVRAWRNVKRLLADSQDDSKAQGQKQEQRMQRCCKRLCKALGQDFQGSWAQLQDTLSVLLVGELGKREREQENQDNRELWAMALQEGWWSRQGPSVSQQPSSTGSGSVAAPPVLRCHEGLRRLIQFYLSVTDGTVGIERQLGKLTDMLKKHDGPMNEDGKTLADLMQVHFDGPSTEAGLFKVPDAPAGSRGPATAADRKGKGPKRPVRRQQPGAAVPRGSQSLSRIHSGRCRRSYALRDSWAGTPNLKDNQ